MYSILGYKMIQAEAWNHSKPKPHGKLYTALVDGLLTM